MKKFEDLTKNQKNVLVGRVARAYDSGMSLMKIAEDLNEPPELIHDVLGIILTARNPEKYGEY